MSTGYKKTCVTHFACDCLLQDIDTLREENAKLKEAIGVAVTAFEDILDVECKSYQNTFDMAHFAGKALTRIKEITEDKK